MAQYRKKPLLINAVQVKIPGNEDEIKAFIDGTGSKINEYGQVELQSDAQPDPLIAYPGDWIIKGVEGELYPCSPSIFEATYDAAGFQEHDTLGDFLKDTQAGAKITLLNTGGPEKMDDETARAWVQRLRDGMGEMPGVTDEQLPEIRDRLQREAEYTTHNNNAIIKAIDEVIKK